MTRFYLSDCGIVCALGHNLEQVRRQMLEFARSGLAVTERWSPGKPLPLGAVDIELPSLAAYPVKFRSRNNQLALHAIDQIRQRVASIVRDFGSDRVGVVVGTSTSGISGTEQAIAAFQTHGELPADFHYAQQEMGNVAEFIAAELKLSGPVFVHSSACSSSAKAMASAARLIQMGVCDAVVTGGVDSLCRFTVAGFSALESVSQKPCQPMSENRDGINIGEGAALFILSKDTATVELKAWGESSDGHHMSAPDPTGAGAKIAIREALRRAKISADEIDYINMHGTATVQNDAMESLVIHELFGDKVLVSSTKPFTGHTLGAAAAIEAALCWICLQDDNSEGQVPPHLWDGQIDPVLPQLKLSTTGSRLGRPLRFILSNSFAFGGSNACLILGRSV